MKTRNNRKKISKNNKRRSRRITKKRSSKIVKKKRTRIVRGAGDKKRQRTSALESLADTASQPSQQPPQQSPEPPGPSEPQSQLERQPPPEPEREVQYWGAKPFRDPPPLSGSKASALQQKREDDAALQLQRYQNELAQVFTYSLGEEPVGGAVGGAVEAGGGGAVEAVGGAGAFQAQTEWDEVQAQQRYYTANWRKADVAAVLKNYLETILSVHNVSPIQEKCCIYIQHLSTKKTKKGQESTEHMTIYVVNKKLHDAVISRPDGLWHPTFVTNMETTLSKSDIRNKMILVDLEGDKKFKRLHCLGPRDLEAALHRIMSASGITFKTHQQDALKALQKLTSTGPLLASFIKRLDEDKKLKIVYVSRIEDIPITLYMTYYISSIEEPIGSIGELDGPWAHALQQYEHDKVASQAAMAQAAGPAAVAPAVVAAAVAPAEVAPVVVALPVTAQEAEGRSSIAQVGLPPAGDTSARRLFI